MRNQYSCLLLSIMILMSAQSFAHDDYSEEIKKYAARLYNSFDQNQLPVASRLFEDTNRLKWNNLPVGMRSRPGISVGSMNLEQRKLLHRVLSASLS